MAIINGTPGNDPFGTLNGTADNDEINGLAGNDTLYGAGGADVLNGGTENDIFFYEFSGDVGDNMGNKDTINGGAGSDTIQVLQSVDFVGATITSIEKLLFTDLTAEDFRFVTLAASQVGAALSSALNVTGDNDDDIVQFNMATSTTLNLSAWTFTNWTSGATVFAGDRVQINGDADSETITGTSINDYIESGDGNDSLYGRAGADTFIAGAGNDILDGGVGVDQMNGGTGNDTYYVDNILDLTSETGGSGSDYVVSSVNFSVSTGIERLYLSGITNINATGNAAQNDILVGNSGNNVLNGLAGADLMRGGLGNDTYHVDNVGDTTDEVVGGGGSDYVFSSVSFTAAQGIDRLYLTGAVSITGTGRNLQNDILGGNTAANELSGLSGNDVLIGGLGLDTLSGGTGLDTFRFDTLPDVFFNRDRITDFVAVDDSIQLENAIFTQLTATGALNPTLFNYTNGAIDADDRILYNSVTGGVFYDVDGSGVEAAVLIVALTSSPVITAADFFVY